MAIRWTLFEASPPGSRLRVGRSARCQKYRPPSVAIQRTPIESKARSRTKGSTARSRTSSRHQDTPARSPTATSPLSACASEPGSSPRPPSESNRRQPSEKAGGVSTTALADLGCGQRINDNPSHKWIAPQPANRSSLPADRRYGLLELRSIALRDIPDALRKLRADRPAAPDDPKRGTGRFRSPCVNERTGRGVSGRPLDAARPVAKNRQR
jgi:hypothetical protein